MKIIENKKNIMRIFLVLSLIFLSPLSFSDDNESENESWELYLQMQFYSQSGKWHPSFVKVERKLDKKTKKHFLRFFRCPKTTSYQDQCFLLGKETGYEEGLITPGILPSMKDLKKSEETFNSLTQEIEDIENRDGYIIGGLFFGSIISPAALWGLLWDFWEEKTAFIPIVGVAIAAGYAYYSTSILENGLKKDLNRLRYIYYSESQTLNVYFIDANNYFRLIELL